MELDEMFILRKCIALTAALLLTLSVLSPQPAPAESGEAKAWRPRVALALGGGGTRGVAHVGVLRIFEREGIPVDGIAGTSIGAIVGGLYAAGVTVDEIENKLLHKSLLRSYHTVPIPVRVAVIPVFFVPHIFGYHPYDGLYRGNMFANYLNKSVPQCDREIENLKIPFKAVAANLLDAKAYAIEKGNLGRAIQASSAIPVLRRPVQIDDKLFVDGGIQANLPAKQARQFGADIVIAVDVDETFSKVPLTTYRHIGSVGSKVINMLLVKVDESQREAADIIIQPNVNGIGLLTTKTSEGKRAIKAGEEAALKAIPAIKAKLKQLEEEHAMKAASASGPKEPGDSDRQPQASVKGEAVPAKRMAADEAAQDPIEAGKGGARQVGAEELADNEASPASTGSEQKVERSNRP